MGIDLKVSAGEVRPRVGGAARVGRGGGDIQAPRGAHHSRAGGHGGLGQPVFAFKLNWNWRYKRSFLLFISVNRISIFFVLSFCPHFY